MAQELTDCPCHTLRTAQVTRVQLVTRMQSSLNLLDVKCSLTFMALFFATLKCEARHTEVCTHICIMIYFAKPGVGTYKLRVASSLKQAQQILQLIQRIKLSADNTHTDSERSSVIASASAEASNSSSAGSSPRLVVVSQRKRGLHASSSKPFARKTSRKPSDSMLSAQSTSLRPHRHTHARHFSEDSDSHHDSASSIRRMQPQRKSS